MIRTLLLILLPLILSLNAIGTHLRSGQISYKRISNTQLTYEITITVFTDSSPSDPVLFGTGELRFGDEDGLSSFLTLPEIQNNTHLTFNENGTSTVKPISEDLAVNVSKVSFTIRHTYSVEGKYAISYIEPNRNPGILNAENGNSVNTRFIIESILQANNELSLTHRSPIPLTPSVFTNTLNEEWSHSLAHVDSNDYKLRYFLVTPKKDLKTELSNYFIPSGVTLDPISGLFSWDAPNNAEAQIGEYIFAVSIVQYDSHNGEFVEVGRITQDFQVILIDSPIDIGSVVSEENRSISVVANSVQLEFFISNASNEAQYEVFSELEEDIDYTTVRSNDSLYLVISDKIALRSNPYPLIIRMGVDSRVTDCGYLNLYH